MNFDLNQEQQLLADSLKRFVTNDYTFDARAKIVESAKGWSEKVWGALAEMGLMGLPIPAEFDGFGGTAVDVMIVMEAIGEALVVEPYLPTVGLGGQFVKRGGSPAQQKRLLPAIAQGARWRSRTPSRRPLRPGG
jgi:alkylation response protein AidB-like acyl-CoA dehydrogenase